MSREPRGGGQYVRVWDLPVRLFHWSLVLLMVVSYFTGRAGGDWMKVHFWSGYAILTLLLFRICWGFVGSTTARFSDFIKGPAAGLSHLAEMFGRGRPHEAGHNPLGGLMVVVLLLAALLQAVAGLFSADTDTGMVSGPLANRIADKWVDKATAFHHSWVNVLLALVALHILAVVVYLVLKRQNLVRPMLTGRKPLADVVAPGRAPPRLAFASGRLAFSVLIACAAVVYFIIRAGG
ncbi:MAG: cytochrome b/b6 domain-containing protein [Proteobacteria bacterium]|nr:cytochrome b/b6 domain-containing protein [Pseudomonadota bacterium]